MGASSNATFQLFFGNHNGTDLIYYADPENVTAAISLLNSAEEFYTNFEAFFEDSHPDSDCSLNVFYLYRNIN